MASQRLIDDNGYMTVAGCPISSFGIFQYGAGQVGLPGDPNRVVNVYRPESAVNNQATIDSFKNLPLIDDHAMLSGFEDDDDSMAPEDYGMEGILTSNVYFDAPWLRGDLKVFTRRLQRYLAAGKEDLSLGYGCEYIIESGTFEGQDYEVIQTNLRGNHIALVGEGRVKGARVLDGMSFCYDHLNFDIPEGNNMPVQIGKKKPGAKPAPVKAKVKSAQDNALEALKALIPQIEQMCGGGAPDPAADPGKDGSPEPVSDPSGEPDPAPAADPQADPSNPDAGGEPVADPVAEPDAGAPAAANVQDLVSQITALMGQLQAAAGGEANDAEPCADGTDPAIKGLDDLNPDAKDDGENGDPDADQGADSDELPGGIENGQGKASPGPAAGIHAQAGDAALRGFYADLAVKDRIYQRVSKAVGAFDHRAMDSAQVGAYGVRKLGLTCAKGQEVTVLDAYFKGLDAGMKGIAQRQVKVAKDSADNASEVQAYIMGTK